jgi:hypothetical protein
MGGRLAGGCQRHPAWTHWQTRFVSVLTSCEMW